MAESQAVFEANNVELVASNIQNKVGATLLGARAMAEETTGNQSEGSINVLEKIRELQFKTVEKITGVWEILKSQFDLEKDVARREAENAKELALERQGRKKKAGRGVAALVEDEGGGGFDMKQMLATIGTTLLTVGGLRAFASTMFRGGIWALIGMAAGKAMVNMFDINSPAAVDAIKTTLPTAAAMLAMFKLKTALLATLPIVSALGIASITNWMTGGKAAHEVTNFDWASAALTGPAIAAFARYGLGIKFGTKLATLGGLVFGWPVVIAGSLAIALGAGMGYIINQVEQIETSLLSHLEDTVKMSQKEFEDELVNQRTSTMSKWSIGLQALFDPDKLNIVQQNVMAVRGAKNVYKDKGQIHYKDKEKVLELVDLYANLSPEAIDELLSDKHKLDDVANLKLAILDLAHSGALGDDRDRVMVKLMQWEKKITEGAEKRLTALESSGQEVPTFIKEVVGGEHDTWHSDYGKKFNIFKRFQEDTIGSNWHEKQKHIAALENDERYVRYKAIPWNKRDKEGEMDKYIEEHEKKILAAHMSGTGRGMYEKGVMDMPPEANIMKMMEWYDLMLKDENKKAEIMKAMNVKTLKKLDEKKGTDTSIIDGSTKVDNSKINNVSAPIYSESTELGSSEEKSNVMSGLGSGWASHGWASSDIRLKENIKFEGKSLSDINIYSFKYKNKEGRYKGVMAQEVPWASFVDENGYLKVDYSKLDVDFVKC